MRAWLARLRDRGLSRSRVRKAFVLLRKATNDLIEREFIERDPCIGLSRKRALWPEKPRPRHLYLDPHEIDALRDSFPERYRALVEVLAWGGLRIGEAFALTRADIDLEHGVIHVSKSQDETDGVLRIVRPKNGESRTVSIGAESRRVLSAHLAQYVGADQSARLFTTQRGIPLRYSNFRTRIWIPAVTAAGWSKLKPHDLRASCASNLFALGWQPKDVQTHLGHKDALVTLNVYTEFVEAGRRASVTCIDQARRRRSK